METLSQQGGAPRPDYHVSCPPPAGSTWLIGYENRGGGGGGGAHTTLFANFCGGERESIMIKEILREDCNIKSKQGNALKNW